MSSRLLLVALAVSTGCEVRDACEAAEVVIECGAEQSDDGFDQQVDGCVSLHKWTKKRSDACADTHLAVLRCLADEVDCNTIWDWRNDECGADPATVCAAEGAAFCQSCPGLWFAPD